MNTILEEPLVRSKEYEQRVLGLLETLYEVALNLTKNTADAQEITQATVVKALQQYEELQQGPLKSGLLSLLRETYEQEFVRRQEESYMEQLGASSELYMPEVRTRHRGAFAILLELVDDEAKEAVDSLPDEFRRAVIMADLESKTYKEIAEAMDCPLGTVRSRLFRGRRLLWERLE